MGAEPSRWWSPMRLAARPNGPRGRRARGQPRAGADALGTGAYWWNKPLKELRLATFNARIERVTTKPFFREPFKHRRCLIPVSGYYEWVRREVVCVIVRRRHPAEPAVPSAVPYEVRRFGNEPSTSPRRMYPTVLRRVSNLQGDDISASIRRTGARVDGTVSVSKPLKVSSSMKGPKMLSGPRSAVGTGAPFSPVMGNTGRRHMKRDLLQSCHTHGTR